MGTTLESSTCMLSPDQQYTTSVRCWNPTAAAVDCNCVSWYLPATTSAVSSPGVSEVSCKILAATSAPYCGAEQFRGVAPDGGWSILLTHSLALSFGFSLPSKGIGLMGPQ